MPLEIIKFVVVATFGVENEGKDVGLELKPDFRVVMSETQTESETRAEHVSRMLSEVRIMSLKMLIIDIVEDESVGEVVTSCEQIKRKFDNKTTRKQIFLTRTHIHHVPRRYTRACTP